MAVGVQVACQCLELKQIKQDDAFTLLDIPRVKVDYWRSLHLLLSKLPGVVGLVLLLWGIALRVLGLRVVVHSARRRLVVGRMLLLLRWWKIIILLGLLLRVLRGLLELLGLRLGVGIDLSVFVVSPLVLLQGLKILLL